MYIYIYCFLYISIYIYIYIPTYIHTYIYIYMCRYRYEHIYRNLYIFTQIWERGTNFPPVSMEVMRALRRKSGSAGLSRAISAGYRPASSGLPCIYRSRVWSLEFRVSSSGLKMTNTERGGEREGERE